MIEPTLIEDWIGKKIRFTREGRTWYILSIFRCDDGLTEPYIERWHILFLISKKDPEASIMHCFQFRLDEISWANHIANRTTYLVRLDDDSLEEMVMFEPEIAK